ncbi:hypothetical protein CRG98_015862 [Punica granatum]|uniref:Uncharacterized protein n=1 Tax=Punica granatum TaxID=22663 RepID=A0A2I0K5D7_PUNGR|nr:hypothetical protein CRG98_015862 [Punica granatum]
MGYVVSLIQGGVGEELEFGLSSKGPITLPCDAAFMGYVVSLIQGGVGEELEFGLSSKGPITLPCDAAFMGYVVSLIQGGVGEELEKALLSSVSSTRCVGSSREFVGPNMLVCGQSRQLPEEGASLTQGLKGNPHLGQNREVKRGSRALPPWPLCSVQDSFSPSMALNLGLWALAREAKSMPDLAFSASRYGLIGLHTQLKHGDDMYG